MPSIVEYFVWGWGGGGGGVVVVVVVVVAPQFLETLNRLHTHADGPSDEAFLSVNDIDCNRVEHGFRIAHTDILFRYSSVRSACSS